MKYIHTKSDEKVGYKYEIFRIERCLKYNSHGSIDYSSLRLIGGLCIGRKDKLLGMNKKQKDLLSLPLPPTIFPSTIPF